MVRDFWDTLYMLISFFFALKVGLKTSSLIFISFFKLEENHRQTCN